MERWMKERAAQSFGGPCMSKFVEESERKRKMRLKSIKSTLGGQLKNSSNKHKHQSAASGGSSGVRDSHCCQYQPKKAIQSSTYHNSPHIDQEQEKKDFDLRNIVAPSYEKTKSGLRLSISDHHHHATTSGNTGGSIASIELEARREHIAQANKNIRRRSAVSNKTRQDNYAVLTSGSRINDHEIYMGTSCNSEETSSSSTNYQETSELLVPPTDRTNIISHLSSTMAAATSLGVLVSPSSTLSDSTAPASPRTSSYLPKLERRIPAHGNTTTATATNGSDRSGGQHQHHHKKSSSSFIPKCIMSTRHHPQSEQNIETTSKTKQSCSIRVMGPLECQKLEKKCKTQQGSALVIAGASTGGAEEVKNAKFKKEGGNRKKLLNQKSSRGVSLESLMTEKEEAFRILQEIQSNNIMSSG
jgi:hypothetical protein